jgi:Zinc carboxypeptidase
MRSSHFNVKTYVLYLGRMKHICTLLLVFVAAVWCTSQAQIATTSQPLDYYLPKETYDPAVPTPEAFLGYQVGDWHVTHDQLLAYMRELARTSPRVRLQTYGYTHERRPLVCLTIGTPDHLSRLDEIRTARRLLTEPDKSPSLNPADHPAVVYMGYSIHGNEASGSNAALLVAYRLAASQSTVVEQWLSQTIVLFDPCFNPDGLQRFATWVNSHRSQSPRYDPNDAEFNEHWPGGRTNHYWFDLNRDWLPIRQPESGGRVQIFQDWRPNVLTDHHEMGSQSTFFFQPGVPSRVNPITPERNQQLTAAIALYHARTLDVYRVSYYSGESYDDFYYGKGSTYPDANGCVGILFEQGSSRGSAQETDNGLLTFAYSVRNQVLTSFSTLQAVSDMRVELNGYLRDFYTSALVEARRDSELGYIVEMSGHASELLRLLEAHRIESYHITNAVRTNGFNYEAQKAIWVPLEQPQYRLVKAMFERRTTFTDSIFYDISAWTYPDAFGVQWSALRRGDGAPARGARAKASDFNVAPAPPAPQPDTYAYIIPADATALPRVLPQLHKRNIRVKVATLPFTTADSERFEAGSLLITLDRERISAEALLELLKQYECPFQRTKTGLTPDGPDLGSNNFVLSRPQKVLIISGEGASPTDAGELWYALDALWGMSPTVVEASRIGQVNLSRYTTVVLPDGNYTLLGAEKLKSFVNDGGTLIATGGALRWLKNNEVAPFEFRTAVDPMLQSGRRPYAQRADDGGARQLSGAIFNAALDRTHPVCFGYKRAELPVFLADALFLQPSPNVYNTPVVFTASPLLAGYVHSSQQQSVSGAGGVVVHPAGRGRVIGFAVNPCFRGFWLGSSRLLANAVLFGHLVR